MNHWLWFAAGVIASFGISFLAMIGWWFLLTRGKQNKIVQLDRDFDTIRDAIRRANHEAQRN